MSDAVSVARPSGLLQSASTVNYSEIHRPAEGHLLASLGGEPRVAQRGLLFAVLDDEDSLRRSHEAETELSYLGSQGNRPSHFGYHADG